MNARFFRSASDFRRWLQANGRSAVELWVGFYKVDSGKGGIPYAEALDEALCFGWIDGVRKRVDAISYQIRFTPRRPKSHWSRVNIGHAERLKQSGKMTPAGLAAYAARGAARRDRDRDEQTADPLSPELRRYFQAQQRAWGFFQSQPPGCRRRAVRWVMSAKREETRRRRLTHLIEHTKQGRRPRLVGSSSGVAEPQNAQSTGRVSAASGRKPSS